MDGEVLLQDTGKRGLSSSTLKLIAIVTMLIDHIGAAVLEPYLMQKGLFHAGYIFSLNYWNQAGSLLHIYIIFRYIGRIAFPIFCFLLVEGFYHTRNRKKYAIRLFIFALLSEIPFDLAFSQKFFDWGHQNVFFTLFLGLCVLIAIDSFKTNKLVMLFSIFLGMALAFIGKTDYDAFGVIFVVLLYQLRDQKWRRALFCSIAISWEWTAPLAFIPIHFYNGKRGLSLKYIFYAFYPIHLLILYFILVYYVK